MKHIKLLAVLLNLILVAIIHPAIADSDKTQLYCRSQSGVSEALLTIDASEKRIEEFSRLFSNMEPTLRPYRDGTRVTTEFGVGSQFVEIGEEFIKYGTRYDSDPNGFPGAVNIVDRRTGTLKWGSIGNLSCEVAPPREQIPKKF